MRFDIALMHGLGAKLVLDDVVGVLEALLEVAVIVMDMPGDVGRLPALIFHVIAQDRSLGLHRLHYVEHRGQHLVIDLDQVERFLGDMRAGRRHHRHAVAMVQNPVLGDKVLNQMMLVVGHRAAVAVANVGLRREVLIGDDRFDAGMFQRFFGVD